MNLTIYLNKLLTKKLCTNCIDPTKYSSKQNKSNAILTQNLKNQYLLDSTTL